MAYRVKPLPVMPAGTGLSLHGFCSVPTPSHAQGLGLLSLTWEIQMEFLAPTFDLAQLCLL